MLILEELEIVKFKNDYGDELITNQKMKFGKSLNLLIGPNGGGKTTLLKILQACVSFDFEELKENEFEIKVKGEVYFLGIKRAKIQAEFDSIKKKTKIEEKVELQAIKKNTDRTRQKNILNFKINYSFDDGNPNFTINKRSNEINIYENEALKKNKDFYSDNWNFGDFFSDLKVETQNDKKFLNHSKLSFLQTPSMYRRGVEDISELEAILRKTIKTYILGKPKFNPFPSYLFSEPEYGELNNIIFWELGKFLENHKDYKKIIEIDNLDLEFKSDFLQRIKQKYTFFDSFIIRFSDKITSKEEIEYRDGKIIFFKNKREMDFNKATTWGQKRFIYLLSKIEAQDTPLIDEIENGFHPKMVRDLINSIYEQKPQKQAFVTTHSHHIINSLNYDSMEELGKSIVLCKISKEEKLTFANLKGKNLEVNFNKVRTGLVDLPESLLFEGIW
ncbi:MAG: hypothetical protein DWQ06_10275 [Calditrichaeota bacterium]|nr:MAG: hypothetical protein DWQ06_10275 [Calditrichota bacterium]